MAEPGGAAATAALLKRRYQPGPGERIGVVISGGDTVAVDFSRQEKSVADLEPRALRP